MKLASLLFPNGHSSEADKLLLQRAECIKDGLPEPSPGSQIAIAFDHDRIGFAAALIATWLKGHGAAIVENTSRERIMSVVEQPQVQQLLHDTDSHRLLQVPRYLEAAELPSPPTTLGDLSATPALSMQVQTDDGQRSWCSWNAEELAAAIDTIEQHLNKAIPSEHSPTTSLATTPGLVASLFVNTLIPLRQGRDLDTYVPVDASNIPIPSVPKRSEQHQKQIDALLQQEGVTDAAVLTTPQKRTLLAIAGPNAHTIAAKSDDIRAFATLPRDCNNQLLAAEVFLAFGLGRDGEATSSELIWTITDCTDNKASVHANIPSDYLFYEGHFTNYPILAGGVQLHELILPCLRELQDTLPSIRQLDGIKFLSRIEPGDAIEVAIDRSDDGHIVDFDIQKQGTRCTSGRLHFAAPLLPLSSGSNS